MPYYRTIANLNLYKSPALESLVTQAAIGRYLVPTAAVQPGQVIPVRLVEDDYPGLLAPQDWQWVEPIETPYQAPQLTATEIRDRLPQVIAFTEAALQVPNTYLWGGTVAPNYDCSGLMQAAFHSVGIQLPRDAYQQEGFVQAIAIEQLEPGDLVFFGTPEKATHVALYLGDNCYIHSSGKDQGRNGIGIDQLSAQGDEVSRRYYAQLRGAGRVVTSYQPSPSPPS
ncbi:MAG: NlpC/P60 family protein [Synechococcales bacterium]|nr:NlpC/P60 family protein [Synechococcales bacterium]